MIFKIDHVTLAASRLEALAGAFASSGLAADYGGIHSNAVTHMSFVGFDDGSYIELVSVLRPNYQSPWWHEHIVHEGGPCAWAVQVDDVAAEAERLQALGVKVEGPIHMQRKRPDGQLVEWDVAFIGNHGIGALHPFIINDRTPRELRASASASVAGSELAGVDTVFLGVEDAEAVAEELGRAYDLPEPQHLPLPAFGERVLAFPGEPLALVSPESPDSWLAQRLARFGPTPCAYLLASLNLGASRSRLKLGDVERWGGRRLAWFDTGRLHGAWLGVVAR